MQAVSTQMKTSSKLMHEASTKMKAICRPMQAVSTLKNTPSRLMQEASGHRINHINIEFVPVKMLKSEIVHETVSKDLND